MNFTKYLALPLLAISLVASYSQSSADTVRHPLINLTARTALNTAGAAIFGIAIEKCIPNSWNIGKELGHLFNAQYWITQELAAFDRYNQEKRNWNTIQKIANAVNEYTRFLKNLKK